MTKIPVTIVSGFLGAGKTTLVNHLLSQCVDAYFGIIVNEFGEVGIDGQLIIADDQPVIEIANGCICCTVRKDLTAAVSQLLALADRPIDRLIIETSGLADPAPVLQSFLADGELMQRVELESVITVADAYHIAKQISSDLVREQLAFADVIVLTKTELTDPGVLARVERDLAALNPAALCIRSERGQVSAGKLLGTRRFSLPNVLSIEPGLLDEEGADHEHDDSIGSCSVEIEGELEPQVFNRWISDLVRRDGEHLLRTKGVLNLRGEVRQFHCHSVHMLLDARPGRRWHGDESRLSRMVFIGRGLSPAVLRDGFLNCLAKR